MGVPFPVSLKRVLSLLFFLFVLFTCSWVGKKATYLPAGKKPLQIKNVIKCKQYFVWSYWQCKHNEIFKSPEFRVHCKICLKNFKITQWWCTLWKMWVGNEAWDYQGWNANSVQAKAHLCHLGSWSGPWEVANGAQCGQGLENPISGSKTAALWALINQLKSWKWSGNYS